VAVYTFSPVSSGIDFISIPTSSTYPTSVEVSGWGFSLLASSASVQMKTFQPYVPVSPLPVVSTAQSGTVYNYITLAQMIQQVANRLYDPTMTFWTQVELGYLIDEALQTWNALTSYWRGDFTFSAQPGVTWYDLTSPSQMPNTLRSYNVTDSALYTLMEYHLLEPAPTLNPINPWTGSLQFSANDLLNAVQRRRDEILSITGCTQSAFLVPASGSRVQLGDNVIDVRRIAYLPASVTGQPNVTLWPEDTWGEQSFNVDYTLTPPGSPSTYLLSTQPPLSFDTDVRAGFGGYFEMLTVNAGAALSVSAPSVLYIPDDWTHLLKWGALADLLSREWDAKDIPRADYCEKRYRLGLAAMLNAPALLAMRMNNVPLQIDSVRAADLYDAGWESTAAGAPTKCYHSGLNLIALATVPDAGAYSLTATVVQNAPLPANFTVPVQVGRDDLDAIIDYAQHLAAFKMGGEEFFQTMPLFQRFLKQAALYNGKLKEMAEYQIMLQDLSQRERDMNPVTTPDSEQAATT
jgi:hypothetical protein